MEVEAWIKQMKELNISILSFLESESDSQDEFQELTKIIDKQKILKNERSIKEIIQLLYKIGDNHHRTTDFFDRFSKIIIYLKQEVSTINDAEIIKIFKENKRLFLLLFEFKIINPDESILKYLMNNRDSNEQKLYYYFFSEIKDFLGKRKKKRIEYIIQQKFNENIETFESKIKKGENDSIICKMIRKDSIEEFVSYVNQTNLSLTSTIKADFYESNSFLIKNKPSLIEYAFFYGSIQVIKYLRNNHVEFPPNICQYAIHSNNPEMIEFLEENGIEFDKESVIESIKCHHNDITDYISDKLKDKRQDDKFYDDINLTVIKFNNYYYFQNDITIIISNPSKLYCELSYLTSLINIITIPSSVTSIGNNAFDECSSLTQISIPSSVIEIGKCAFYRCSSLTQISFGIPSSLTSIGEFAFASCSSLEQISIPSSVTEIGNGAFFRCSSLTQISFEISSSLTSIGSDVFYECLSLTQISIPSSVASIGDYAFYGCLSLTQISIPSSITEIGNNAFYECLSLTQISIPSSITEIGNNAFYGCSSLTQIIIPLKINTRNLGISSKARIFRTHIFTPCSLC